MAEPRGFDPTVSSGHWDSVLKALANESNRLIVEHLRQSAEPITIDDLSHHLLCQIDHSRTEILVKLHHTNLPTLERVGLIEFEPVTGRIVYKSDPSVEELIDAVVDVTR